MANARIARNPRQNVRPRRVRRQRLEQVMASIAVNFVEANEESRFSVQPYNVARRNNLPLSLAVSPRDFLIVDDDLGRQDRIDGDQVLGER